MKKKIPVVHPTQVRNFNSDLKKLALAFANSIKKVKYPGTKMPLWGMTGDFRFGYDKMSVESSILTAINYFVDGNINDKLAQQYAKKLYDNLQEYLVSKLNGSICDVCNTEYDYEGYCDCNYENDDYPRSFLCETCHEKLDDEGYCQTCFPGAGEIEICNCCLAPKDGCTCNIESDSAKINVVKQKTDKLN